MHRLKEAAPPRPPTFSIGGVCEVWAFRFVFLRGLVVSMLNVGGRGQCVLKVMQDSVLQPLRLSVVSLTNSKVTKNKSRMRKASTTLL